MTTYVGLLRGINVGGHNKLPMADLRAICESAGLEDVRTYIQSGNLVFSSEKPAPDIEEIIASGIETRFGFRPKLQIIPADRISSAAREYPFPVTNHKLAHLMFLDSQPEETAIERLNEIVHSPDKIVVGDRVVYLYFPNGVSGSKTDTAKIERILGVSGTGRNWRTVEKLIEMSS